MNTKPLSISRFSALAAAVVLLFTALFTIFEADAANNVPNATESYKTPTYNVTATNPANLRSGVPPVGYEGLNGAYTTVKSDRPLPVTVLNSSGTTAALSYASSTTGAVVPVTLINALPVRTTGRITGYSVLTVPAVATVAVTVPTGTEYMVMSATVPFQMALDATAITQGTVPITGASVDVNETSVVTLGGYLGATSTVTVYKFGR